MKIEIEKYHGLSSEEAQKRLKIYGYNVLKEKEKYKYIKLALNQLKDPYLLLLLFVATLSIFLGDKTDAIIILVIVFISSVIEYWQELKAQITVDKLLEATEVKVSVIRDGKEVHIPLKEIVPGDLVTLTAGDMIPGDSKLIESKNIFVNESLITGESYPVEKKEGDMLYMGSHVVSGFGIAEVVATGKNTEYGKLIERLKLGKEETEFEKGLRNFGFMLFKIGTFLVIFVFIVNTLLHKGTLVSLLFALSLGIGITPTLLPAILNVGLSYGASKLAKLGILIKRLTSIENIGSMDVFCSDKTGTLTIGEMKVKSWIDAEGKANEKVLKLAYLNSYFQTGYKNPIDEAIKTIKPESLNIEEYQKINELPYDFNRKRLSVLLKSSDKNILVTKGAFNHVLEICSYVEVGEEKLLEIDKLKMKIEKLYEDFSNEGYKVIAVAYKSISKENISYQDEKDLIFIGFILLHDPLKPNANTLINNLKNIGVELKIITGDNKYVAMYIKNSLSLKGDILTGEDLKNLSEAALIRKTKTTSIFAELTPLQKEQVVLAIKKSGHTVGYMGDGVNDVAAMRVADVSVSVDNAVDIAKDTADIILLKKDLLVIQSAILEGRKSFINTLKYLFVQTSSNFGNVFSMTGSSVVVPFIPMLPKQVLMLGLISTLALLSLPLDNVDDQWISKPKKWNINFIKHFMYIFGIASSLFDYVMFFSLIYIFKVDPYLFRSAWFLESLSTQILALLVLRTKFKFFKSRPSKLLLIAVILSIVIGLIIPFTPLSKPLELYPLSLNLYIFIALITLTYLVLIELLKSFFYKKNDL